MGGNQCYKHALFFATILSFSVLIFFINNDLKTTSNVSTLILRNILHVGKQLNFLVWTLPCIFINVSVLLPWGHSHSVKELRTKSRGRDIRTELRGKKSVSKEYRENLKNDRKPMVFKERKYNRHVFGLNDPRKSNVEETFGTPITNKRMTDECQYTKYYYHNTNMAGKVSVGDLSFKNFGLSSGTSKFGLSSGTSKFGVSSWISKFGVSSWISKFGVSSWISKFGLSSWISKFGLSSGTSKFGVSSWISKFVVAKTIGEIKLAHCFASLVLFITLLSLNTIGCWNITITTTSGPVGFKKLLTVSVSSLFHRSSNGLYTLFTLLISRNVNSNSHNTIPVPKEIPVIAKHWKLRKINGKNNYEWLHSPNRPIYEHLNNVIAYPVSQFYRLASFRPLAYTEMPHSMFFINLSSAGFHYPGTGTSVVCSGCRNVVDLALVKSDPSELKYHKEGCSFATSRGELRMYTESNNQTPRIASHEVQNEAVESTSNDARVGEVSTGGHVNGDTDDGIDMMPPDMSAQPLVIVSQHDNELQNERVGETFRHVTDLIESPHPGQLAQSDDMGCEPSQSSSPISSAESVCTPTSISALPGRGGLYTNNSEIHITDAETPYCDMEAFKPENPTFLDNQVQRNRSTVRCEKNPGHLSSFPLSLLRLDHLPSKLRYKLVTEFLGECVKLTVQITVSKKSSKRPSGDNTNLAEVKPFRSGTGSVLRHPYEIGISESNPEHADPSGTITRLRHPEFKAKNLKRIFIETSRNLIFNNEDAKNSTVQFLFDTTKSLHGAHVTGKSVIHSTQLGDCKSVLVCEVPEEIVAMLNRRRDAAFKLAERLPESVKEAMTQHVFIISYPHGGEPEISHGDSTLIKYIIDIADRGGRLIGVLEKINGWHPEQVDLEKTRKTLLYTAVTCDGALGAPVITFQRKTSSDPSSSQSHFKLDIWTHYGFDRVHELNVSMMKGCTRSDFPPHGIPLPSTASVRTASQTSMASTTTDQQTPCLPGVSAPLSTVLTTPAYPVYSNTQKRLESFTNWPSNHVHTPAHLASAGFFYAGYADCVRCFQCGLGLKSWKPGDDVIEEHERHRPSCPFLRTQINSGLTAWHPVSTTSWHPVSPTVHHGVANQDADSARNSSNETATMLLRPEVNGSLEQRQQTRSELSDSDNGALPLEATELQHQQTPGCDENKQMQSEALEERNHPKSLPVSLLERENKTLKLQVTCKICRKAPIKDLFLPCGDLYACSDCSQQLTHCPACNKLILATVTTYFS
ncbi:unnamed protein product [Lymnaea stagnalis]|uniref:RING-type domain-containing protein n=1 Tax=Lymnaea stagnalis TaxID=6523 RepID=A0AAV2HS81_LYMST